MSFIRKHRGTEFTERKNKNDSYVSLCLRGLLAGKEVIEMAIQDELAFELDIEPEALMPIDENWVLRLMQKGVLVALHIGYWRPYSRLSESELGEDGSIKEYLQLGRKKLLPPDTVARLENIEKRARYTLEENSFRCFWGRFVPVTAWNRWRDENENIKSQFYAIRDEVISNLPNSIGQLRDIYSQMAAEAYKRSKYDQNAEVPESFINSFTEKCLEQIPSSDDMRRLFRYEEVYTYIPLPNQLISQKAGSSPEDAMRRQVAQEMNDHKQEMVADFLAEINTNLRSMVVDACRSVRDSIRRNERLVPRSVMGLRNLLSKLERLNFHDDEQLTKMMDDIRSEIDKPSDKRSLPNLDAILSEILAECKDQIQEIESWRPSRYEALELVDAV